MRAYRVARDELVDVPRNELRERMPGGAALVKLRRDGEFLDITDETTLAIGDEVAVVGTLERFVRAPDLVGPEIIDSELLDMETESAAR